MFIKFVIQVEESVLAMRPEELGNFGQKRGVSYENLNIAVWYYCSLHINFKVTVNHLNRQLPWLGMTDTRFVSNNKINRDT